MRNATYAHAAYTGLLCLLLAAAAPAFAEETTSYTNESFARLSFISGKTYIQRAAEMGYDEGEINMPISEGDRLGTTDGRAEIYLFRGKYVRLDHNTKVDFLKLPDRNESIIQLRIWSGNVYIHVERLDEEKSLEVHTTDVSLYILDKGTYRIDVRENTETEVFVFTGLLEAALDSGSFLVKDEKRIEAVDGRATSRPTSFVTTIRDSFDFWNNDRNMALNLKPARRYLPDDLEDFEYELERSGEWDYVEPFGNVWLPRGVSAGWHPYTNGRWLWLSLSGWTWLPFESWGWVTFHFGRWHWGPALGWYWIPTRIWGPAWVSWYWGPDYWAWAPMSYYGYPGVILNNRYVARHTGYYPLSSPAVTVIRRTQLQERNVSKVALQASQRETLKRISLTAQSPTQRPVRGASIQDLDGKKQILKNSPVLLTRSNPPPKMRLPSKKKAVRKEAGREKFQERSIRKSRVYPSSPGIGSSLDSRDGKTSRSRSVMGRFYDYISTAKRGPSTGGKSILPRSRSIKTDSSSRRTASSRSSSTKKSSAKKKK